MNDHPSQPREHSHSRAQSVEGLSRYAVFSNTLNVWKAIEEMEEDDIQDDDIEIMDQSDQASSMSFQHGITLNENTAETSEKYRLKSQAKADKIDNQLASIKNEQDKQHKHERPEPVFSYSPIRAAQAEHTFPRNVRRKVSDSASSPASAPPTTIRRSPMTRPSPSLGSNSVNTSMMATPTDLSLSSNSSEGLYNNEGATDAGSLERNVSSLNIAIDSPLTKGSPLSKYENKQRASPQRQQHTPPTNSHAIAKSPRSRPEKSRSTELFAKPAAIVPKKTNEPYRSQSFTNYDRKVPHPPREQEKITINKHDYTILKEIGRGSSGKVFQVLGHTFGQILAVKWIEVRHDEDRKSIMNEIELLKSLDKHDNIVSLLDYRATPSVIFMVMEYGEIDLAHLIQRQSQKSWDINFIKYYWNQMLHAVYVIHHANIVHSDLKPANFVIVKGCLKLIDFGIAKKVSDDTTNIERIVQVGTINYMSPEALLDINEGRGEAGSLMKLGRPSDIWSLGCILYQMVYGKTPFFHLPLPQKIISIPNPDYNINFPETITNAENSTSIQLPVVLLKVLKDCLNRNPALRPPLTELMSHSFVN